MVIISSLQSRLITGLGGLPVMQEQDDVVLYIVLIYFLSKKINFYLGAKRKKYSVFYVVH